MAMDDDWEAEYERDRQLMMQGGGGGSNTAPAASTSQFSERPAPPRNDNPEGITDEEAYAQYTGAYYQEEDTKGQRNDDMGGGGSQDAPLTATDGMSMEDAYYAAAGHAPPGEGQAPASSYGGFGGGPGGGGGSDGLENEPKGNPRAFPKPGDSEDGRFLLPYVQMPDAHKKLFGEKIGRLLYWAGDITMYFKGWFSPAEQPMVLFCTPHGLWIGDPKTGEILLARMYRFIRDLLHFQDKGMAFVGRMKSDVDIIVKITKDGERDRVSRVVRQIARCNGTPVSSFRVLGKDAEKSFRSGATYTNPKDCSFGFDEDPRTGVALVEVPEKFRAFYPQLIPKIMHFFGGVFQLMKDWKGALQKERRGCWVTATCFFISMPDGPQNDGRDIKRCIGVEYIDAVFSGPGGEFGIKIGAGPKQPDCGIVFDSLDVKERVIHALRECYYLRTKRSLRIEASRSVGTDLKLEKEKDFKPQLFVMKTRQDLYGLLREKTSKMK